MNADPQLLFQQYGWPVLGTSLISLVAAKRKSLTPMGGLLAWIVGFVAGCAGMTHFIILMTFFVTSTILTSRGKKRKMRLDPDYVPSGNRNVVQVFCNGGTATILLLLGLNGVIPMDARLHYAVLAHYCACQGDTWSSELGILAKSNPRLILGLRMVPAGTNGGVTLWGFMAAMLGGWTLTLAVALNFLFSPESHAHFNAWEIRGEKAAPAPMLGMNLALVLVVTTLASLGGSMLDSVLGQLFQSSGLDMRGRVVSGAQAAKHHITGMNILSNDGVNLLTAAITTVACYVTLERLFDWVFAVMSKLTDGVRFPVKW